MAELASFHLLRPGWLWAFVALAAVVVLLARRQSPMRRWQGVIAPHLLEHLVIRPRRRRRLRPTHLLAAVGALSILALGGPSWEREPSPFSKDTAPLVIALELSPAMEVRDVQPSRLARARHKIRDLVERRAGSPTALLAYAGSAHRVVPLTDDPAAITAFVDDLEPSLMPVQGRAPSQALELAAEMLDREGLAGTVLFVAPGIPEGEVEELEVFAEGRSDQVQVLAVATEAGGESPDGRERSALDRPALERFSSRTGAVVTVVTVDDSDVERIQRRAERHVELVESGSTEGRWRDEGWWLVWPVAALALLWFRRGWSVTWEGS